MIEPLNLYQIAYLDLKHRTWVKVPVGKKYGRSKQTQTHLNTYINHSYTCISLTEIRMFRKKPINVFYLFTNYNSMLTTVML